MERKIKLNVTFLFLIVFSLAVVDAAAYIKFDGVDGEAKDKGHMGWSNILSFEQAIHQPGAGATSPARRRGAAILEDIVVTKELDKSSPKLQEAITTGKVFPKLEIELTSSFSEGGRETYYKYELKNVMVTSYSISGSGQSEDVPIEEISLNFEEIKVTYNEYDEGGIFKGAIEFLHRLVSGKR